jgi:hypothetical protein
LNVIQIIGTRIEGGQSEVKNTNQGAATIVQLIFLFGGGTGV